MAKKGRKVTRKKNSKPMEMTKKKVHNKSRKKVATKPMKKPSSELTSMSDIETYYAEQKKKIDNAVKRLERNRLREYLKLVDQKKGLLNEKKNKLEILIKDIAKHADDVKKQIAVMRMRKGKEKHHFDELYGMNEHLKNIEQQVKDVVAARKELLSKENKLLDESKNFFKQNKGAMRSYGIKPIKNIGQVLDRKTKILNETALLINKDASEIFKDKKILERITDAQLLRVANANDALKKLDVQHRNILKRKQGSKAKTFNYKQQLAVVENKRKDLIDKLRKIH